MNFIFHLTRLLLFLATLSCTWQFLLGFALVLLVALQSLGYGEFLMSLIFCSMGCTGFVYFLKEVIGRERPLNLHPILPEPTPSFPSGHAAISVSFYGYIFLSTLHLFPGKWLSLYTFSVFFFIWFVGFSRIYFRMHYWSDVIAGYLIGFAWVGLTFFLF